MILGTPGDGWTVVQQHADVDAHDCHDAAHVQVHHEDPLKSIFYNVNNILTIKHFCNILNTFSCLLI
jgi:hypothetical protein